MGSRFREGSKWVKEKDGEENEEKEEEGEKETEPTRHGIGVNVEKAMNVHGMMIASPMVSTRGAEGF